MDVRIRIETHTQGTSSVFEGEASCHFADGGAHVRYVQEGDEVVLTLSSEKITMRRTGNVGLFAEFIHKKRTDFSVFMGGSEGKIPVFTEVCLVKISEKSIFANLKYELLFQDHSQKFYLKIFIRSISEEK